MTSELLSVRTLTDGGQRPADIAGAISTFLGEAQKSLELALYDFHLVPATAAIAPYARMSRRAGEPVMLARIIPRMPASHLL